MHAERNIVTRAFNLKTIYQEWKSWKISVRRNGENTVLLPKVSLHAQKAYGDRRCKALCIFNIDFSGEFST